MAVSDKIVQMLSSSSFIRTMFEAGAKMKAEFGEDQVFDFSLGNPSDLPPEEFTRVLREKAEIRDGHKYMPNSGYEYVRRKVAEYVSLEQEVEVDSQGVIMTSGAGGALNVILKTILNPKDKVLASTPCFMEYRFYCDNHGGRLELVEGTEDFNIDIQALEKAVDASTAGVIINSPNNPSGRIYPEETIIELSQMLKRKSEELGRVIYLISDEPYRKIVFDNNRVPPLFPYYENSVVCTSYSKDLSIPGERIGWLMISPRAEYFKELVDGSVFCNRILGYVNAPALMQKTIAELQGVSVDIENYRIKRDRLCSALAAIGYEFLPPQGTFYLFIKVPGGDDLEMVQLLQEERILTVPGRGFGKPGYFRIAFCVSSEVIENSLLGFSRAYEKICNKVQEA